MNCSIILNTRLSNGLNFHGLIQPKVGSAFLQTINIYINQTITVVTIQGGAGCEEDVTLSISNIGLSLTVTINSIFFLFLFF